MLSDQSCSLYITLLQCVFMITGKNEFLMWSDPSVDSLQFSGSDVEKFPLRSTWHPRSQLRAPSPGAQMPCPVPLRAHPRPCRPPAARHGRDASRSSTCRPGLPPTISWDAFDVQEDFRLSQQAYRHKMTKNPSNAYSWNVKTIKIPCRMS